MAAVNETDRLMLMILSVDPSAGLKFSTFTKQWYVDSSIGRYDDHLVTGISEHRDNPALAIQAFFNHMVETPGGQYLFIRRSGAPRMYEWNGAAFVESYETAKA